MLILIYSYHTHKNAAMVPMEWSAVTAVDIVNLRTIATMLMEAVRKNVVLDL